MRRSVTPAKLEKFMVELAARARSKGNVYFTGGATALLLGIREQTIDIDLKLDPEPAGVFEAIAHLKNELDINVELASPDDFIPVARDWKERSQYISQHGLVTYFHFDLRAQILSKVERGHAKDKSDALEMANRLGLTSAGLLQVFKETQPEVIRYPALDAAELEKKVRVFLEQLG